MRDNDGEGYDFPKTKAKTRRDYVMSLYPIKYNNMIYDKKDCNDLFISFYTCKEALNGEGGVYLSEQRWIYPDGTIK
jgi:hypothetical protein